MMAALDHFDRTLVDHLREQGYAVLPGFLQADEIEELSAVGVTASADAAAWPAVAPPTRRPPDAACRLPAFPATGGGDAV